MKKILLYLLAILFFSSTWASAGLLNWLPYHAQSAVINMDYYANLPHREAAPEPPQALRLLNGRDHHWTWAWAWLDHHRPTKPFITPGQPHRPPNANPVPEPSTFILIGAGIGALAWIGRKRLIRQ